MRRMWSALAAVAILATTAGPAMAAEKITTDNHAVFVNAMSHTGPVDEAGNWLPGTHRWSILEVRDAVWRADGVPYLEEHFINIQYGQATLDEAGPVAWDYDITGRAPYETLTFDEHMAGAYVSGSVPGSGCWGWDENGGCSTPFSGTFTVDLTLTGVGKVMHAGQGWSSGIPGVNRTVWHGIQSQRAAEVTGTFELDDASAVVGSWGPSGLMSSRWVQFDVTP